MPFLNKQNSDFTVSNPELQQSHAELLQIFEESSIGIAIVSTEGKWIKVNPFLCNILDYTEEELLGLTFNDVTYSEDTKIGSDKLREVLEGKIKSIEIEKRYIRGDGTIIHCLVNSSLVRYMDGTPKYFVSQIKDVTSMKTNLDALRLSEEKFRLVFEKAPIGITHFDKDGNITMVNQFLADLFGSTIEKISKINTRRDIPNSQQKIAFETALSGKVGYFEGPYTSITGGKNCFIKAVYSPLFNISGEVIGGIGITEDISHQKEQEERLFSSLNEKELLLHEVYHRVKNNLQTVISLINIQINESANSDFITGLKETKSRLYAMSKVHEVLCQSDSFVSITLSNYIQQLVSNFDFPNVNYRTQFANEVSLTVNQTNSIGIIINELITNSVKHNFGTVLKITLDFSTDEKGLLVFNYSDNGSGIKNQAEPLGTSLGMNLVNLLVEDQLEGSIKHLKKVGFHVEIRFKP